MLEKAREIWPDAATDGAGVLFSDWFVRGVRRLWSQAYQSVSFALITIFHLRYDPDFQVCDAALIRKDLTTYPISRLMEFATKQLEELKHSTRPQDPSPGFNLAYWEYIKANALA